MSGQFVNRAVSLVDRDVEQGRRPGIGVRDGDTAERLATADEWIALVVVVFVRFVKERIAPVHVAVRPAIDGDRLDVSSGSKPPSDRLPAS